MVDQQDAICANMRTKEHLRALHLIWDEDREDTTHDTHDQQGVLEGLQPHFDLKELMIKGFPGVRFPSWLASSFLPNLQTAHICNCRSTVLPPLGQLPFLKNLNIAGATEVTQIGLEFTGLGQIKCFPALEELVLEDMPKLNEWIFDVADQLFPQLTELGLINCPKLKKLPPVPSTLATLRIDESGLESLPDIQNGACPSSLTSLYINGCPNLTSLRVGLLAHNPTALKSLTVARCDELVSLPEECFCPLKSLQILHIYECPCLVPWTALERGLLPTSVEEIRLISCSLLAPVLLNGLRYLPRLKHFQIADYPDTSNFPPECLPQTLQFLDISWCDDLQFLPPSLYEVSSLETLHISNCREIEGLPEEGLPSGLRELYIKKCWCGAGWSGQCARQSKERRRCSSGCFRLPSSPPTRPCTGGRPGPHPHGGRGRWGCASATSLVNYKKHPVRRPRAYTQPWPHHGSEPSSFPQAEPHHYCSVGLVGFRFAPWPSSDGGGGRERRRRWPHHRQEAGAVVELDGVALRPRRNLLPLPRPARRASQDRGVAEQGLPPGPRGGDCNPLRDKAARSLLPEWSCLE